MVHALANRLHPGLTPAFRRLWAAQTISVFGDAVTNVALPSVAVLSLHAGSLTVGFLNAAGWSAWGVLALVAGVWVDRLPRRPLLVAADLVRLVLVASVPLAWTLGVLSVAQLLVVAAVASACGVVFGLAYTAHVPDVVDAGDLGAANQRLELSSSAAFLAGPSLAGFLISVANAPLAMIADAASFAASAVLLAAGEQGRTTTRPRARFAHELGEGVRVLRAQPILRRTTIAGGIANFGFAMVQAVFFVYAYRTLGLSAAVVGIALTLGAVGSIAGVVLTQRITARIGIFTAICISTAFAELAALIYPLALVATPALFLALGGAVRGFLGPWWNVNVVTLRQQLIPTELQARVTAASRTVVMGTLSLGSFAGGALGSTIGVSWTIVVGALAGGVSGLLVLPRALG
jgi:predicted MFS family arabinose efflux permease